MPNRNWGFATLLMVVGVSIVFGMILGGRLNAPPVVYAAPDSAGMHLSPAQAGAGAVSSFADIVDRCLPAVVTVTSVSRGEGGEGEGESEGESWHPFQDDP